MSVKQIWVSPKSWGWWRVHKNLSQRDTIHSQIKDEAIKKAMEIAKNQKIELRVQNKDWRISKANSYWRDSFPPRG